MIINLFSILDIIESINFLKMTKFNYFFCETLKMLENFWFEIIKFEKGKSKVLILSLISNNLVTRDKAIPCLKSSLRRNY